MKSFAEGNCDNKPKRPGTVCSQRKDVVAMTREEIRGIVNGITDEQLKSILDINSSDIGKAKAVSEETKKELEEANKRISEMEADMDLLKNSQDEAEKMKNRVEELQKIIDERAAADEKAEKKAILEKRFSEASNGAEFLNDYTRQGVFALFEDALGKEENMGKADNEIFGELVQGSQNLFAEKQNVPSVVASTSGFGGSLSTGDVREIMGLARND